MYIDTPRDSMFLKKWVYLTPQSVFCIKYFLFCSLFFFFFFFFFKNCTCGTCKFPSKAAAASYTTATATPDLSHICDLCCSLWQCWIRDLLIKPRIKLASSQRQHWVLNPLQWELPISFFFFNF